jgi:hypothetical protein
MNSSLTMISQWSVTTTGTNTLFKQQTVTTVTRAHYLGAHESTSTLQRYSMLFLTTCPSSFIFTSYISCSTSSSSSSFTFLATRTSTPYTHLYSSSSHNYSSASTSSLPKVGTSLCETLTAFQKYTNSSDDGHCYLHQCSTI